MLRRILRGVLIGLVLLVVAGVVAWQVLQGPDPAEVLARVEVPPAPVLAPAQALEAFRVAPGFRVELVASEPLVVDPVAMDWDDQGLLYVVEMRGYMPTLDGSGEEEPVGRVVILEDTDGDGVMDRRDVFLDGLVMPRAVAVVPEGVLVGAPPDLFLCRDTTGDRVCDAKTRVLDYAAEGDNPEHLENGLLLGMDGWIYNAKSERRFRVHDGGIEEQRTVFRGQWGIAQNDDGQFFYNHNSGLLYGDAFPGEYLMRQAYTAADPEKLGINLDLAAGEKIWGVRVAVGLNRAYLPGTLRADGRQNGPTGVSGLAIQRGDQYGDAYKGHAFVPESAGYSVAHVAVEPEGLGFRAEHRLYDDDEWGQREFLASTDERFRPVDADFGPDGAIWVIDMYRGVIQHAAFVSDHLREHVVAQGLEAPGATGRIWRLVREDRPIAYGPPALGSAAEQLAGLDHPNGWVRDRAQRRLANAAAEDVAGVVEALRRLEGFTPLGRTHALWALHALDALDPITWRLALSDEEPRVRRVALRVGEALFDDPALDPQADLVALFDDPDPGVALQALHSAGSMPAAVRPLERLAARGREGDELARQAALSGLAGLELPALERELAEAADVDGDAKEWWSALAAGAFLASQHAEGPEQTVALLDLIAAQAEEGHQIPLLEGIARAARSPGSRRVELASAHPLFEERDDPTDLADALAGVRPHITWPGDPRPGGARALTSAETARREQGAELFAVSCATCHGAEGRGQSGLAPSLVASPWVRDADEWLVRIALHGLTGPLRIHGEDWNNTMPGHGHDPRFDDETLAGLLTHLRRSWGHADEPVSPESVARIREETRDRRAPWTVAELLELPVTHRLDRYVGIYKIPMVNLELAIERSGPRLMVGRREGGMAEMTEAGDGIWLAEGMRFQFETDGDGVVEGARVLREGTTFPVTKTE